jgi:hypothetical protein
MNTLMSQYGTYPAYPGYIVADHLANAQDNLYYNNTYHGTWNFMGFDQNENVTWTQWRAGFNDTHGSGKHFPAQDAGSTLN